MNPYFYVKQAVENGESLLSLCCGIGLELSGLQNKDITAVDIAQQYLDEVKHRCDQAKTVCSDSLEYIKKQPDNSVDVISIIDGIEHMTKEDGLECIEHMKRVCKKQVLLLTPQGHVDDGYLKNEPHNAWGIEGADEHQKHLSGWTVDELKDLGFKVIVAEDAISQHNDPYTALMMRYVKNV